MVLEAVSERGRRPVAVGARSCLLAVAAQFQLVNPCARLSRRPTLLDPAVGVECAFALHHRLPAAVPVVRARATAAAPAYLGCFLCVSVCGSCVGPWSVAKTFDRKKNKNYKKWGTLETRKP